MTELERFAQHARRMSTAEHKDDCPLSPVAREFHHRCTRSCTHPEPHCPGCVTDADRELWTRLADEAEAWLARNVEEALPI